MEALTELVGGEPDAVRVRDGVSRGRLDGTMEGIAIVLTDACLADCIEELGDAADYPSTDELNEVLPGIIKRHGIPATRIMLAIAGEAPAAAIIREILKSDETLGLPAVEASSVIPLRNDDNSDDRDEVKARRKEGQEAGRGSLARAGSTQVAEPVASATSSTASRGRKGMTAATANPPRFQKLGNGAEYESACHATDLQHR